MAEGRRAVEDGRKESRRNGGRAPHAVELLRLWRKSIFSTYSTCGSGVGVRSARRTMSSSLRFADGNRGWMQGQSGLPISSEQKLTETNEEVQLECIPKTRCGVRSVAIDNGREWRSETGDGNFLD